MRKKWLKGMLLGLGLVFLFNACLNFRPGKTIVREPETPGESTIEYQVPSPPSLNLLSIAGPMLSWRGLGGKVTKVCEGVYLAQSFGIANMAMVVTNEGLVIIDTLENPDSAKEVMERFKKISAQPVKYLIYTHGHGDHTQGSSAVYNPGMEVIASKDFIEFVNFETQLIGDYLRRARDIQTGVRALEHQRVKLPMSPKDIVRAGIGTPEIVMPTITFEGHYEFELGGEKFELFKAPGETPDTIFIWLPKKRVLFCGDNYYMSFPNLSSPMLGPRPIAGWISSLEKAIALKPAYLVPGHSEAIIGEDKVMEVLTNYHAGVKSVYDQTIACINQGKTVEEAVQEVKLPKHLAGLKYLKEYYGRVDWSVRGIYQGTIGWYDGNGANLVPLPLTYRARELVKLAGGADKILVRAIELQKAGEDQLAVELCEVVLQANPEDKTAHIIKAVSLEKMAMNADNLNKLGLYLSASQMEFQVGGYKEK